MIVILSLWQPWQPADRIKAKTISTLDQNTNTEFKFYDLLPQQKVTPIPTQAVPEHQTKQNIVVVDAPQPHTKPIDADTAAHQAASTPKAPHIAHYILQVRSYEDPDNADARRADISVNGLAAEVIIVNEKGKTWYKVVSGPYDSPESAYAAQQILQNSGIDSIIVKQP